ncbi:MAG: TauD/TfdA family dioxygenase [Alphaproteobacteria bacterium]|nr:TauD/TfdA family dioxygenase [Alphaproteobacteria bacterium]
MGSAHRKEEHHDLRYPCPLHPIKIRGLHGKSLGSASRPRGAGEAGHRQAPGLRLDRRHRPQARRRFGPTHWRTDWIPLPAGLDRFPEISSNWSSRRNFGGIWHSDTAYPERPPMASMLLAREVPPDGGGDTLFSNM